MKETNEHASVEIEDECGGLPDGKRPRVLLDASAVQLVLGVAPRTVGVGAAMSTFRSERQVRMRVESDKSVDALNELLRGEFSAVETYRQAIAKLGSSPTRAQLEECHRSHEQRVAKLREQVRRLGGEPADGSGAWGAFARLVEGGAKAFGEKAAVGALEEGEDHGLKLYRDDLDKLDATSRQLVETDLLPAQEQTHRAMSTLKHTLH